MSMSCRFPRIKSPGSAMPLVTFSVKYWQFVQVNTPAFVEDEYHPVSTRVGLYVGNGAQSETA